MEKLVNSGKSVRAKGKNDILIEELLLASMYLENIFLEYQNCDIYTSYWALLHQDQHEEELYKAIQGHSFF